MYILIVKEKFEKMSVPSAPLFAIMQVQFKLQLNSSYNKTGRPVEPIIMNLVQ